VEHQYWYAEETAMLKISFSLYHPFLHPLGDEDSTFINWMMLKKGAAQRCGCGHWFQLAQANPTKLK